jgi:Asp-tRNA(Asn)/Glu-tRNA(Gln) amidotransferase A subunit family amidase
LPWPDCYWNFEARQRRFGGFGGPFRRFDRAMDHSIDGATKRPAPDQRAACAGPAALAGTLLAVLLLFLCAGDAHAQAGTTGSPACAAAIRAVQADIAARDLDTSQGPPLNAFLTLNPNAVAQAEALDRRTAAGEPRGPLFCVPVAVKDNFDTYDMPTTVGSLALIGNQPPRDAPFVERLRKAGAIIVGKTNMDELAMGIRGLSGAGGRVGNAYDTEQSAGGSSSGSAVAVGAGFVPLAIGSDNCGSLRIPATYNGAVSLRATYGRFDVGGVFPIGFVNGVPGVITRDTPTLRAALAVVGDGWRADAAVTGGLRGKRIGVLRRFDRKDPWSPAEPDTQGLFMLGIALIQHAGAEIVEEVALDDVNIRLGPEFLKGFARKVDAAFESYPGTRRNWRDVCQSGRIRPEWSARECEAAGASAAPLERQAATQIAANQSKIIAAMDRLGLDAVLYPVDGRGGARSDDSDHLTCFIASTSGLPAVAFPIGLDVRGLPVGLELMGRPQADETLVAMMGAFETVRGPLPRAAHTPARADLAALDIARQNELRLRLGWSAFRSRRGKDLGALAPDKFRALTEEAVKAAVAGR